MKKWLTYLALAALIGGAWMMFAKTGKEMDVKHAAINQLYEEGASDVKISKLREEIQGLESTKILNGVLLAIFSASLIGVAAVLDVLPAFAQRVTHAVYDSAEMMEHDVMHDARSLLAQGDFHGAIEGFKKAAAADPLNRLPWVEIAKIYKDNLRDPASAIQTIRHALERQEWEVNDAAYFLFRLAELYDEVEGDRASAVSIMNQVVEHFPGTRHAANATHKLHEWSTQDAAREEEAYIAGLAAAEHLTEEEVAVEAPPANDDDDPGRQA
jgi:tetratricopeptide (TPR) repeat protein